MSEGLPADLLALSTPLREWSILTAYRGSIAHGTYEPNDLPTSIDDKDVIAVAVPPAAYYLGLREYDEQGGPGSLFGTRGTVEVMADPWDVVIYEARKTVHLLRKGNPNVLSLLWLPVDLYLESTPAGRLLVERRELFATQAVYSSFVGYARSQLMKMERGEHKGYMGDKRKALVEQFGYDTKNASHLIRLLRLGIEFLRTGELNVRREDAAELLAIKHGEWSLERVKAEATLLFAESPRARAESPLPAVPDNAAIDKLALEIVRKTLASRNEVP